MTNRKSLVVLNLICLIGLSNAWWPRELPKIGLNRWSELDEEEHGIWRTDFENITRGALALLDGGQTYVVSPLITGLSIDCNASYPIKWIAHFAEEVPELHSYFLKVRNIRRNADIFNPRSNTFTAQLNFYGEQNLLSGNYSCVSLEYPDEVIKNIYVFWQGSTPSNLILSGQTVEVRSKDGMTAVLPCRVSRPDVVVQLHKKINSEFVSIISPYIKFDPKLGFIVNLYQFNGAFGQYRCVTDDDDDPLIINLRKGMLAPSEFNNTLVGNASIFFNKDTQELTCCSNTSKPPKISAMFCFDEFSCDILKRRTLIKKKFVNTGKRYRNGTCVSERIYNKDSGIVRCSGDGIDIFRNFFTDLPLQANNRSANLYFRWDDVKPEMVIDISITTRRPIYHGQNITISCDTTFFYFADGMKWAVRWNNGSLRFFQNPSGGLNGYDSEASFQSIRLQINKNMSEILCFAPIWNTTDWVNRTFELDVHDSKPPAFENPEIEVIQFVLNSTDQVLECKVNGTPAPAVRWRKDDKPLIHESNLVFQRQNGTSLLTIHRVSHDTQGIYECLATNIVGTIVKQYAIYVEEPSSSLGAVGMTFLVLMIIGLVGGMGFLIWKMQLQRRVIDHLAGIVFRDVGSTNSSSNTSGHNGNAVTISGNSDQNPFPSSQ